MQFNNCSYLVLAKHYLCHGRVRLMHLFHVPSVVPVPQHGKEGIVLPFMTWVGIGQTGSPTFIHSSSQPNTMLVMVKKKNFPLFHANVWSGSQCSQSKSRVGPLSKKLVPLSPSGATNIFLFVVQLNKHSRVGSLSEKNWGLVMMWGDQHLLTKLFRGMEFELTSSSKSLLCLSRFVVQVNKHSRVGLFLTEKDWTEMSHSSETLLFINLTYDKIILTMFSITCCCSLGQ